MGANAVGTWSKITSGGNEFEIELLPDGTLRERDTDTEPGNAWSGTWEQHGDEIRLMIGDYVSHLRPDAEGGLAGPETHAGQPNGHVTLRRHAQPSDALMAFVESLIDETAGHVGDDVRRQFAADLYPRLEEWVNRRLLDAMSQEDLQKLDDLLDSDPDPAGVRTFTEAHVPNAEQVLAQALLDVRALYVRG